MRKTKSFSYYSRDQRHFNMLKREARAQNPKVTESAMLLKILADHYERKEYIQRINSGEASSQ